MEKIYIKIRGLIDSEVSDDLYITMDEIGNKENLFSLGIDSLNIIKIILALESEFDIHIKDEDLTVDNLSSIEAIKNMILKYEIKE